LKTFALQFDLRVRCIWTWNWKDVWITFISIHQKKNERERSKTVVASFVQNLRRSRFDSSSWSEIIWPTGILIFLLDDEVGVDRKRGISLITWFGIHLIFFMYETTRPRAKSTDLGSTRTVNMLDSIWAVLWLRAELMYFHELIFLSFYWCTRLSRGQALPERPSTEMTEHGDDLIRVEHPQISAQRTSVDQ
jgi:hypothetical protein